MSFQLEHPFDLPPLPPALSAKELFQPEAVRLTVKANKAVSELKGLCHAIPNPYTLLMNLPVLQESRDSSAIEGVHTTLKTLLENQIKAEKYQDPPNKEALRYKTALFAGRDSLQKYKSLSTRSILNIHKHLILGGGQFKTQGNKIVSGQKTIYTPPNPTQLDRLMGNWEQYVHSTDDMTDPLIKIIVSHYQFEALHPFSDGNGRTGRILIILQMCLYGLLDFPILYISNQLFKCRREYYSLLLHVSKTGKWMPLISFFLRAFEKQAQDTKKTISCIIEEWKKMKQALGSRSHKRDFLDHLFNYPVTHASFMGKKLNITYQTAGKYLFDWEKARLLKSHKSGTYKLYYNTGLLKCLKA